MSARDLLSEGLDLCVRARKLDEMVRADYSVRHGTRSGTPALWVQDQYDTDVADWERRARAALATPTAPSDQGAGE